MQCAKLQYHEQMSETLRQASVENHLALYATVPYTCNYLPDRQARSQIVIPANMVNGSNYGALMAQGFRRSGGNTYRPWCDHCQACQSLRIPVERFAPNRSQRRVAHQHQDLRVELRDLEFIPEHYRLYQEYQHTRHAGGGMDNDNEDEYCNFILNSTVPAVLVEFYQGDALKMVSLVDVVPDALSAVYTFYANDAGASYGTYSILWQIQQARRIGRPYLYLGYWIEECQKMRYKTHFRPYQILRNGQWIDGGI